MRNGKKKGRAADELELPDDPPTHARRVEREQWTSL